jgi:hypothetical protein
MVTITSNTLVDFITSTDKHRISIVKRLILIKDKGYPPFYASFDKPAIEYLTTRAVDDSIIQNAICNLPIKVNHKWHKLNRDNTALALKRLFLMRRAIRELSCRFERVEKKRSYKVYYPGLTVNISPSLVTKENWNDRELTGLLRFYLAKNQHYALGSERAELMASLMYKCISERSGLDLLPDKNLCIVVEVFQKRITKCPINTDEAFKTLEKGAQTLSIFG